MSPVSAGWQPPAAPGQVPRGKVGALWGMGGGDNHGLRHLPPPQAPGMAMDAETQSPTRETRLLHVTYGRLGAHRSHH